jgi:dihydrofolate reductase
MGFRQNMRPMAIIVAVDEAGGFGKDGKIPWHNKEDFKHFKDTTMGHPCIMGRKTYEDMRAYQSKKKDEDITEILPGRQSFVVTSNRNFTAPGATAVGSIREAVQSLDEHDTRPVFILGGERMYIEALPWVDTIHMTVLDGDYQCDRFFPIKSLNQFHITSGRRGEGLKFVTYKRKR